MASPIYALGVICALASAIVWGGGDYVGGVATRRSSQFHVLTLSALSGLGLLLVCAILWREAPPSARSIGWALGAGVAGAVGIASLYRGLALGQAAVVAPTSGVLAAAVPVAFGMLTYGIPAPVRLAGLALALLGIWLVSGGAQRQEAASRQAFLLACLAGVSFGAFFVLLGLVEPGAIFVPLILARGVQVGVGLLMTRASRLPLPSLTGNPVALLAGLLDVGGNVLYILAKQFVRLDVAAVLASLYPASTVLLAAILLKEKMSHGQRIGLGTCLLAIVLITA